MWKAHSPAFSHTYYSEKDGHKSWTLIPAVSVRDALPASGSRAGLSGSVTLTDGDRAVRTSVLVLDRRVVLLVTRGPLGTRCHRWGRTVVWMTVVIRVEERILSSRGKIIVYYLLLLLRLYIENIIMNKILICWGLNVLGFTVLLMKLQCCVNVGILPVVKKLLALYTEFV